MDCPFEDRPFRDRPFGDGPFWTARSVAVGDGLSVRGPSVAKHRSPRRSSHHRRLHACRPPPGRDGRVQGRYGGQELFRVQIAR